MGINPSKRKKQLRKMARDWRRANQATSAVSNGQTKAVEVPSEMATGLSFEEFARLEALADLAESRLKTFYEAGIQNLADFSAWTEKDLLSLKGIGPATIKSLVAKGITLKH